MSGEMIGTLGIAVMLFLFFIGLPIAFTMALAGFLGFAYISGVGPALNLLTQDFYEGLSSYPLSVIPMFILMGCYAFIAGISDKLYDTAHAWVGKFRGGLTMATIAACAGFGAICGSSAATAATIGKIAFPEMRKYGYQDQLASGALAAGGVLGILIPPSTVFIVYGILVEESIGKLFISGVLPGIVLCILYIVVIAILCYRNPKLGPAGPGTSWAQKIKSIKGLLDAFILFAVAIGGLFAGWFSPTQSGAIGSAGALIIGLARKQITLGKLISASKDALITSCMVMFIISGAVIFGHFMAVTGLPTFLANWLGNLPIPRMAIMTIVLIIFLIGGCIMDAMALIVVAVPLFYPLVKKLGFDPIWFGVMIVYVGGMGVITPPVGVNVFVIKGIAPDVPLHVIFRGIMPFLLAILAAMGLAMVFPSIATWLPSLITY